MQQANREAPGHGRLKVDVQFRPTNGSTLAEDVRTGLAERKNRLPPKYFYDDTGSKLFDRICDTPEYYPTRTEQALLDAIGDHIVESANPTDIVELGSGAARKTRRLFDALERKGLRARYVPFDVSESMLRSSARHLLREYPWLEVHGVVGDYERHLDRIPRGARRLILFIGSTIGNFEPGQAVKFLRTLAEQMGPDDRLLLGTDLVKDVGVLNAAYNDAAGVTEAFNKNVLRVINRELQADFRLDRFDHVAFFSCDKEQVEMHLRSRDRQSVRIGALDLTVDFARGETIHTEISRKFTKQSLSRTLAQAGLDLLEWHTPGNDFFALSLSRRVWPPG
jgi:L-histidine N-alpha-methyltransferase